MGAYHIPRRLSAEFCLFHSLATGSKAREYDCGFGRLVSSLVDHLKMCRKKREWKRMREWGLKR